MGEIGLDTRVNMLETIFEGDKRALVATKYCRETVVIPAQYNCVNI